MKLKLIFIGLLLVTTAFICRGQWTDTESGATGIFRAIKFKNQSDGFILGHEGIVMKTTNQGQSWTNQPNDLNADIFDFKFINDTLIYAYGSGMIYVSTDFGASWEEKSPLPSGARMAYFLDKDTGFAGGNIYGLYRTDNGGNTWSIIWDHPADNVTYCEVNVMDFINDSVGFACGRGFVTGEGIFGFIIKTVNGGLNWSVVFGSSPEYDVLNPVDIKMVSDSLIIAVGENFNLLRSDDSGETWSVVSFVSPDSASWDAVTATSMYAFCQDTVFVIGETTAWLTKSGCNSKRKILRTTDGGQSWIVQFFDVVIPCYDTPLLNDITFINDTVGISVGNDLILRTTNLGGDTHIPDTVVYRGIEDLSQDQSGIIIFPNPTKGLLTIELNSGDYEILDIFTLSGTIISTLRLSKINAVDLTPFSSGLYILKFFGKQTCYRRIIKTW